MTLLAVTGIEASVLNVSGSLILIISVWTAALFPARLTGCGIRITSMVNLLRLRRSMRAVMLLASRMRIDTLFTIFSKLLVPCCNSS